MKLTPGRHGVELLGQHRPVDLAVADLHALAVDAGRVDEVEVLGVRREQVGRVGEGHAEVVGRQLGVGDVEAEPPVVRRRELGGVARVDEEVAVELAAHVPGVRRQRLRTQAHAGVVDPSQPGRHAGVHLGPLGRSDEGVGGEAAEAGHDHRAELVRAGIGRAAEVLLHLARGVDDALELADRPLPVRVVVGGEVEQEVAGEEVGGVRRVAHRKPVGVLLEHLRHRQVDVLVGEVELQEVGGRVPRHRLDVVVAHGQSPRPAEGVVAAGRRTVPEVGGVEEVAGIERAVGGAADELVVGVGLEPATGALDVDVGGGEHLADLDPAGGDQRLGEVDAVHHLAGGHRTRGVGAEGFLDLADALDHLRELTRQQADLVVVALEAAVDGDVLLDDARAQGDGGDRHVEAALVAGVADRRLRSARRAA